MVDDLLADFERQSFTYDGVERAVFRKGSGPAVIVMAEVPGITPAVADFARRVVDRGLSVYMPDLFGVAGAEPGIGRALAVLPKLCVSREFRAFALRTTAPVIEWLRALARHAQDDCGHQGVGAVGMCFTGGFALAMATEPEMLAPVLSQPSLPISFRPGARNDPGCSDDDLLTVAERCKGEDLKVLGLRFSEDRLAPAGRFRTLERVLGPAFIGVEIDSSRGNPSGHGCLSHSVLTEHLIDKPGEPTRRALDQVLDFLVDRLTGSASTAD